MNVLGVIDESHENNSINYKINLNCDKFVMKIDRELLKTFYIFNFRLNHYN
jgi:hypothetical protein